MIGIKIAVHSDSLQDFVVLRVSCLDVDGPKQVQPVAYAKQCELRRPFTCALLLVPFYFCPFICAFLLMPFYLCPSTFAL